MLGSVTFEPPLKKVRKIVSVPFSSSVPSTSFCMPVQPSVSSSEPAFSGSPLLPSCSPLPLLCLPCSLLPLLPCLLVTNRLLDLALSLQHLARMITRRQKICELRAIEIGYRSVSGKLDLIIYCPMSGKCHSVSIMRKV